MPYQNRSSILPIERQTTEEKQQGRKAALVLLQKGDVRQKSPHFGDMAMSALDQKVGSMSQAVRQSVRDARQKFFRNLKSIAFAGLAGSLIGFGSYVGLNKINGIDSSKSADCFSCSLNIPKIVEDFILKTIVNTILSLGAGTTGAVASYFLAMKVLGYKEEWERLFPQELREKIHPIAQQLEQKQQEFVALVMQVGEFTDNGLVISESIQQAMDAMIRELEKCHQQICSILEEYSQKNEFDISGLQLKEMSSIESFLNRLEKDIQINERLVQSQQKAELSASTNPDLEVVSDEGEATNPELMAIPDAASHGPVEIRAITDSQSNLTGVPQLPNFNQRPNNINLFGWSDKDDSKS